MSGSASEGKKVGDDESENERWMLARDRSGHVRQHPFPGFFPPRHPRPVSPITHPRAVVSFLSSSSLFFLPTTAARSLTRDAAIRRFLFFFLSDHLLSQVRSNRK